MGNHGKRIIKSQPGSGVFPMFPSLFSTAFYPPLPNKKNVIKCRRCRRPSRRKNKRQEYTYVFTTVRRSCAHLPTASSSSTSSRTLRLNDHVNHRQRRLSQSASLFTAIWSPGNNATRNESPCCRASSFKQGYPAAASCHTRQNTGILSGI